MDTAKPITAVIVGGGHRSIIYADYSLTHPEELKIVGIADPNRARCLMAAKRYGFSKEFCFDSAQTLAEHPKMADAIINGTMDHQHYETAVPLLKLGYDMLLEKPFAVSAAEMHSLLAVIREHKNKVMICHVLRYAEFYLEIKKRILAGEIGNIINIQTSEHVSYDHVATSYVRGKWANSDICKTSMLLAKSCHDIDIMMWLMNETQPQAVSSFGSNYQFNAKNAPQGAGTRCMADCPLVDSCMFSAKKMYLDFPERWACYVWAPIENVKEPTRELREKSLKTDNPYGRCVYKCDNNVVDHQSVLIRFKNGATGTHNMIGGSARSMRKIHIIGTKGEISGIFEDNCFTVSKLKTDEKAGYVSEAVNISTNGDGHGGGDDALTADFIKFVSSGEQSVSCTSVFNSIAGHLAVFLADKSLSENGAAQEFDFSQY